MTTKNAEKIPLHVFVGVTATLCGLALIAASTRTGIRFQSQRRLHLDDLVLIFACLTFVATQILLYVNLEDVFGVEARIHDLNPLNLAFIINNPEAFYRQIVKVQKIMFACFALTWTSIFAVKFCFLLFFYQMITRLRRLILAWRVIFGITILFWAFCTSEIYISCPYIGLPALECTEDRGLARAHALAIVSNTVDITSDMLVISIPFTLLWKVKIKRQQKILLGIFLFLSIFMIIIAIVRISGISHKKTAVDIVWELFWLDMEAAIAVIMVSVTAFRSLLGLKVQKAREKRKRSKPLARYFKKAPPNESDLLQLPSIPGATLTGMRTFIHGNGSWEDLRAMGMAHKSSERDLPGADSHEPHKIKITHQFSTESVI